MSGGRCEEACEELADTIVRLFREGSLHAGESLCGFDESLRSRWAFTHDVELLSSVIGAVPGALPAETGHNGFIEAVVCRMAGERHAGTVLDPLVQALYDLGCNGFLIDLTPLGGHLDEIGYCLSGKPGMERLTAAYTGDVRGFGKLNFLCTLRLRGGAEHGGRDALSSEYWFDGPVRNAGRWSESCVFYLQDLLGIPPLAGNPLDCTYYVGRRSSSLEREEMAALLAAEAPHFLSRNRLFVLGGSGGYEEVGR